MNIPKQKNKSGPFLLVTKYTHASIRFTGTAREEIFPLPETALREAVVNAIAHKDFASGNPIQIKVYDDRIMIWNDGHLPENWTISDLLRKHASIPFNPDIARVVFLAGKIEAWGSGIERMFAACADHGCQSPVFRNETNGMMITLPFLVTSETSPAQKTTQKTTQKTEERILEIIRARPSASRREISKELGNITQDGVKYHLDQLKLLRRIRRVGPDRGGHWEVLE